MSSHSCTASCTFSSDQVFPRAAQTHGSHKGQKQASMADEGDTQNGTSLIVSADMQEVYSLALSCSNNQY